MTRMPSSLIPEKPLLIYPSLAATLGLEQACMLAALAERVNYERGHSSGDFYWYQLQLDQLLELFPFWNQRDLQRIVTNLREKGVLIVSSAPIESSGLLRFAFNEKVQQQLAEQPRGANRVSSIPVVNAQAGAALSPASPRDFNSPAPAAARQNPPAYTAAPGQQAGAHFLSKNFIAPNWQPDEATLGQLAQHNISQDFALRQVPEFVTYWRERGDRHHSWGSKFMQHCLRQWRDFESERFREQQQAPIMANWQPSADALEILVEKAGIKRAFVEDAIPEFILYWRERGESHTTWNTKFVQHVRIQWAKYTAAIEHNTDPRPMSENWQPSKDVFDVLRLANIDLSFAQSLIPEFVIYWRDRGQLCGSWNTKYLQHIKRMWAQRHEASTANSPHPSRSTRDIGLDEELTDRSWAN